MGKDYRLCEDRGQLSAHLSRDDTVRLPKDMQTGHHNWFLVVTLVGGGLTLEASNHYGKVKWEAGISTLLQGTNDAHQACPLTKAQEPVDGAVLHKCIGNKIQ